MSDETFEVSMAPSKTTHGYGRAVLEVLEEAEDVAPDNGFVEQMRKTYDAQGFLSRLQVWTLRNIIEENS